MLKILRATSLVLALVLPAAAFAAPALERAIEQIPELMGRILESQEEIRERESDRAFQALGVHVRGRTSLGEIAEGPRKRGGREKSRGDRSGLEGDAVDAGWQGHAALISQEPRGARDAAAHPDVNLARVAVDREPGAGRLEGKALGAGVADAATGDEDRGADELAVDSGDVPKERTDPDGGGSESDGEKQDEGGDETSIHVRPGRG